MIEKRKMHCTLQNKQVDSLVEIRKARSAKAGEAMPINCERAFECSRTTFCRFVNPLTTRNPLVPTEPTVATAS